MANAAAFGLLALLIIGKILTQYLRERCNLTDAATRKLWRDLHAQGLSREQFYTLAARYAEARQLTGEQIHPILEHHEKYSFSPGAAEAGREPVTPVEKSTVLATLRSAPVLQA